MHIYPFWWVFYFPLPVRCHVQLCEEPMAHMPAGEVRHIFDCHTEQIYIYVRNEAAAKSQLLLSKIACKAYYCAPVKIPEQLTVIIKLELSRRPKRAQGTACQYLWEQKYFLLPSLLELQTHLEMGNECSDLGEREHSSPDHSWQTADLQCTGPEDTEAFWRK